MLERQHPLTRRQLLEILDTRGLQIRGANPIKVLGTNLWRSQQFEQIEGLGYCPKDAGVPQNAKEAYDRYLTKLLLS